MHYNLNTERNAVFPIFHSPDHFTWSEESVTWEKWRWYFLHPYLLDPLAVSSCEWSYGHSCIYCPSIAPEYVFMKCSPLHRLAAEIVLWGQDLNPAELFMQCATYKKRIGFQNKLQLYVRKTEIRLAPMWLVYILIWSLWLFLLD